MSFKSFSSVHTAPTKEQADKSAKDAPANDQPTSKADKESTDSVQPSKS